MKVIVATITLMIGFGGFALAQDRGPLPEAEKSTIGYPTVAAALAALRARPDVTFSTEGDWIIATDTKTMALWSFPGKSHPAYPSAVRREVKQRQDGVYIDMDVQCEASKTACDDLVRSFQALNENMSSSPRRR